MNPVETFATYAAACRAVGRGGITPERIRDLFGREDGIDLDALRADAGALASAAGTAAGALSDERTAAGILAAGWRGRSASAATDLLERHCATAAETVSALAGAAEVLERLHGRLARLLETRAEAGVRIAERYAANHPRWLASAAAVLNGSADDAAAAQVLGQVAPFVENDVAGEWVAAMGSVTDGVAAAYQEAVAALTERPALRFEVPSGAVRTDSPAGETPAAVAMQAGVPAAEVPAAEVPAAGVPPAGVPAAGFVPPAITPDLGTMPADLLGGVDPMPEDANLDPEPNPEPDPVGDPEPDPDPDPDPVAELEEPDPLPEPVPSAGPAAPLPAEAGFPAPETVPESMPETVPAPVPESVPEPVSAPAAPTPCETAAEALPLVGPP